MASETLRDVDRTITADVRSVKPPAGDSEARPGERTAMLERGSNDLTDSGNG
jgi:hypothetical protein